MQHKRRCPARCGSANKEQDSAKREAALSLILGGGILSQAAVVAACLRVGNAPQQEAEPPAQGGCVLACDGSIPCSTCRHE